MQQVIPVIIIVFLLWLPHSVPAQQAEPLLWHEGTARLTGATRQHSYGAAWLQWPADTMGSWFDRNRQYLGNTAYSVAEITVSKTPYTVTWPLATLVNQIQPRMPLDLLLRNQPGATGSTEFYSKEQGSFAPQLRLITSNQREIRLNAVMDTYLDNTTYRSLGDRKILKSGPSNVLLLQFAIPALEDNEQITSATLQLYTAKQYGNNQVGVYLLAQPVTPDNTQSPLNNSTLLFREDFSERRWAARWHDISPRNLAERTPAPQRPEQYALKISFSPRYNLALDMSLRLKTLLPEEPEALYFQYDLYLGDNWFSARQGGKLPGLAGTYNKAGWGGRSADGNNGWSARGLFGDTIVSNDRLNNSTPAGFYAYYPDNGQQHGANLFWDKIASKLHTGRWYTLTQYVQLNTPGQHNGILRAWVNNQPVFEATNIRFRDTEHLKIERLWMNVYHGGIAKPQQDMDLYLTNILLALPAPQAEN
ncbi:hypothetical protein QE250_01980 [Chromatiaceae bacterium AAb-1]|nr:hypothetical protein [Chromatiaceae bacterium AAb-1]